MQLFCKSNFVMKEARLSQRNLAMLNIKLFRHVIINKKLPNCGSVALQMDTLTFIDIACFLF